MLRPRVAHSVVRATLTHGLKRVKGEAGEGWEWQS